MLKIAVLIKPNTKIKNYSIYFKKYLRNKYGYQYYIDHFPHITLFTMQVKNKFLNNINNIIKDIKINKKILINLSKISYFSEDPITKNKTIYIKVNKNKNLNTLQNIILKKFKKYKSKYRFNKSFKNFKSSQLKNLIDYGYPFVSKEFKPHITICSIEKKYFEDNFVQKIIKKNFFFQDTIENIYLYEIKNEKHYLIKKINFYE